MKNDQQTQLHVTGSIVHPMECATRCAWGFGTVGTKSRNSPLSWPAERTEEIFFHARKKQF